jgi:outer membrane lipoprotein-sorting protein
MTLCALLRPLPAAEPDWPALENWIARQQTVRTLQGEFTQTRRLPTLRLPSRTPGKIWFENGGSFRFQLGEPPEAIAIRRGDTLTLIDKKKNTVRQLEESTAGPETQQLLLMRFPVSDSLTEFRQLFEVTRMEASGDRTHLDLIPRDAQATKFIKAISLIYETATGVLTSFNVELTNGGGLETKFTRVDLNHPLPPNIFEPPMDSE